MDNELQSPSIDLQELQVVVSKMLAQSDVEILDWHVHPAGLSTDGNVFRVFGTASLLGTSQSWSVILKSLSGHDISGNTTGTHLDPTAYHYWKREALVYQTGVLAHLAGKLTPAKCYAVNDCPNNVMRLWLEDIKPVPANQLFTKHGVVARHLGMFNGSHMIGRETQPASWYYYGRVNEWPSLYLPLVDEFLSYTQTQTGKQWIGDDTVKRMQHLLANHSRIQETLSARLPKCLCHHDAFNRNLFLVVDSDGQDRTVAIDWAMLGIGYLGEEIGIATAVNLTFLEVAGRRAKELDDIAFHSYIEGLQSVSWTGDIKLVRFAYAATAAFIGALATPIFLGTVFRSDEGQMAATRAIGHSMNEITEQMSEALPFFLDLGEEAIRLAGID